MLVKGATGLRCGCKYCWPWQTGMIKHTWLGIWLVKAGVGKKWISQKLLNKTNIIKTPQVYLKSKRCHSDVTWASLRLKSPVTQLFIQQLVQADNKNVEASHSQLFHLSIPFTRDWLCEIVMTSSRSLRFHYNTSPYSETCVKWTPPLSVSLAYLNVGNTF